MVVFWVPLESSIDLVDLADLDDLVDLAGSADLAGLADSINSANLEPLVELELEYLVEVECFFKL